MNLLLREAAIRKAVPLIAEFEGGKNPKDGRYHPYRDPVGVVTQGFGETKGIHMSDASWSERTAFRKLRRRLRRDFYPALDRAIPRTAFVTVNERAAFLSFIYNEGPGMLAKNHTFGGHLQRGDIPAAVSSLIIYNKAGKPLRVLAGLTRRRKAEIALARKVGK